MDKLERHSYDKIDGEWVISKTAILTYERIPYNIPMVAAIQKKLYDVLTPDLVTHKYREENKTNPMYGHCYHTTQALYYLFDTDTLDPMMSGDWRGGTHWWLQDRETGVILDFTVDQYLSIEKEPPHHTGKVTGWYGWKGRPHMRTLKLIQRLQPDATIQLISF